MAQLDPAELNTLEQDITVTNANTMWRGQTLITWYNNEQWQTVADFYQEAQTPTDNIWRPDITPEEFACAVDANELINLPDKAELKLMTWNIITRVQWIDATEAQTRTNFQTLFGGGVAPITFDALMATSLRPGTRGEILYAGGNEQGAKISTIYGEDITSSNVRDTKRYSGAQR